MDHKGIPNLCIFKKRFQRDFLGGSVVKTLHSMHKAQVQSLFEKLRSHMLHNTEK